MSRLFGAAAASMLMLAVIPFASAQGDASRVDAKTVREIEQQIVMPRGAQPLGLYDRYYASDNVGDRRMVVGVLLLRESYSSQRRYATPVAGVPHAYTTMADRLPSIADGGCAVVTIYFDIMTRQLLPVRHEGAEAETEQLGICNGVA